MMYGIEKATNEVTIVNEDRLYDYTTLSGKEFGDKEEAQEKVIDETNIVEATDEELEAITEEVTPTKKSKAK